EQVATHVTVRNVITSMRLISAVEWADFFESVSLVEEVLRQGTRVAAMDFSTRDQYRRAVEHLARRSRSNEVEVARLAVSMAAQSAAQPARAAETVRRADPGFFLIAEGREALEKEIGYRVAPGEAFKRAWLRNASAGYIGTIAFLTLAILAVPAALALSMGAGAAAVILLSLLAAIPASDLAVSFVNRDVAALIPPRKLPKIEIREGIPAELRTLVAVPTFLASEPDIERLIERLEVHFFASAGGDIRFALLSDWTDADSEILPEDERLLAAAASGISRLNAAHGPAPDGGPRFLLLHRRRAW